MKRVLLFIVSLVSAASLASAANNNKYTSTDNPNNSPDGVDQSASPVNVWTVTTTPGATGSDGSGSGFFSPFGGGLGNTWQLYSYQNSGVGNGGGVDAATTFAGGALTIGQTVSIDFEMRATDPGKRVGLSLLNGTGNAITFDIPGGGPGNYFYTDAGTNNASCREHGLSISKSI